jgi:hypothetical protein
MTIHITPVPPVTLASVPGAQATTTLGGKMTSLADLAAKISASKKKRDARTAAISQRVDDLDKRADTLLPQSETVNDDKDHELEELDASLNPDIGHNGSPDRGRSGA